MELIAKRLIHLEGEKAVTGTSENQGCVHIFFTLEKEECGGLDLTE